LSAALLGEALPNLAGAAMLLLGLLLPLGQRRASAAAARLVAWQGGLLALAAASAAWSEAGVRHLWVLALGALLARALLLPTLLRLGTGRTRADALPRAADGTPASAPRVVPLLAGGGLAVLATASILPAGTGLEPGVGEGLALALAILLLGLLAMLLGRGVASGLLGLVAAENGALLALVHAGDTMPGAAVLAVLSPGLLGFIALAARGRGGVSDGLPWALRP
jgi:hydrogenase-4 component E